MTAAAEGTWTRRQLAVVAMIATALMLDGLDAQLLGLAIPALIQEWGVTRAELAPVAALSLVGMALGATFGGWVGDRLGRRTGLIASLALFGVATGLASRAPDLLLFGVLRGFAGLGLGAALPNGTALIAEFSPARYRSIGVSIAMFSQPVGSMVAGLLAAALLESSGWRALFVIGGLAPVIVALLFLRALPESPGYLAARDGPRQRGSFGALLAADLRHDTVLVWIASFMSLLALYTMLSWAPAMLAGARFPLAFTGTAVAAFSVGGMSGSLAVGLLMRRIGSSRTQLLVGGVGILAAAVLCALFGTGSATTTSAGVLMACVGFGAAGTQTTLYTLGAHLYPVWLRATGIGALLGIGRLGAVASSWTGATSLDLGGAVGFFTLFALAIAIATAGCVALRRPVPPVTGGAA